MDYLSWLIPIGLALVHFLARGADLHLHRFSNLVKSLAAGFSVTYVFLFLLPELYLYQTITSINLSAVMMMGFTLFHGAHKYVYRAKHHDFSRLFLDEIHLVSSTLYNLLISFTLTQLIRVDAINAWILAWVVVIHILLSEITHASTTSNKSNVWKTRLIVLANLVGGFVGLIGSLPVSFVAVIYALTVGSLVYISIREELPRDSQGKPLMFVLGVAILIAVATIAG